MSEKKKILMVSLGNICRSPMAETIMMDIIQRAGKDHEWHVESAAIGTWHTGDAPDYRAVKVMNKRGFMPLNRARQIQQKDFKDFNYILCMDEDNMRRLRRLAPQHSKAKLLMLGDFGLEQANRIIEDPYYLVGEVHFEKVFDQCLVACEAFFNEAVAGNV